MRRRDTSHHPPGRIGLSGCVLLLANNASRNLTVPGPSSDLSMGGSAALTVWPNKGSGWSVLTCRQAAVVGGMAAMGNTVAGDEW